MQGRFYNFKRKWGTLAVKIKKRTQPEGARGCSRLEAWDKTVMKGEYLNHAENVTKHTIQRRLLFSDLED